MTMPLSTGGLGNLLIPSMLCSSDMTSPRSNASSVRLVIDSLFSVLLSLFLDGGVNAG
jgi:heme/copper-type cytochrome/quinol oxidase subunit 1